MPFVSQTWLNHHDAAYRKAFSTDFTALGRHPITGDTLYLQGEDRYAGSYVLGVQGVGKSGFLETLIHQDCVNGHAVIVIDPHGDLTRNCLAQMPPERLADVSVLDMEDEDSPFGVNVFATAGPLATSIAQTEAVERIMHIFEVLWPEVMGQQHLPLYVRMATIALLATSNSTLVDMQKFLRDDAFRAQTLRNVTDPTVVEFWRDDYDALTDAQRKQRVAPLLNRLATLFTGRSLVRNIVGQRKTTVNFREAVERHEIIFVKLPVKSVPQDASLVGTLLIAQLHAAIFSFANVPPDQRPGLSLYIDEFQHFVTRDINELFTEGRKFGVRLTVAHQYRDQLPGYLQKATMTARTKTCFHLTPEDAREMAGIFPSASAAVQAEDIVTNVAEYVMTHTPDEDEAFDLHALTEIYLLPLQHFRRGHNVEIRNPGTDVYGGVVEVAFALSGRTVSNKAIQVDDPLPYLNRLLHTVMVRRDPNLPIPPEIPRGFANSGVGFFAPARHIWNSPLLQPGGMEYPAYLVAQTVDGPVWLRPPENPKEQLLHFLFTLRQTMKHLAEHPIGKVTESSAADVAKMLAQLPKRAAFVRTEGDVGVVYTLDTPPHVDDATLATWIEQAQRHTRATYCHPRVEVERGAGTIRPLAAPSAPSSASSASSGTGGSGATSSSDAAPVAADLPDEVNAADGLQPTVISPRHQAQPTRPPRWEDVEAS